MQLFKVAERTTEFDTVAALFKRTLPHLTIDEILRVENGAQVKREVSSDREWRVGGVVWK